MEWVETTGRSLEEAKEAALDQLGVHEDDAEFEVIDEPSTGLFGRIRREARVRARVRPTTPRPKVERRDRGRRKPNGNRGGSRGGDNGGGGSRSRGGRPPKGGSDDQKATSGQKRGDARPKRSGSEDQADGPAGSTDRSSRSRKPVAEAASVTPEAVPASNDRSDTSNEEPSMTDQDVTVEEQATMITEFVEGLLDAFGLDGEVSSDQVDEETIELQVTGEDLGLLIGPKGQTLSAIQELSRTVVQRQASGTHHGRVRLDVSGYRQRRREALERFATQVAEDVKSSGVQRALEPMNAADRKVVHDTINDIDGVSTISEGEDQRRRVVIMPA